MKIAILGWGSLIWNPKSLQYNTTFGWQTDGPMLPLEFSRISQDFRLTLVIDPNAKPVMSLYAISTRTNIDEAILNLAIREGSGRKSIGWFNRRTSESEPNNFAYNENIKGWLENHSEIDAVIWTNLGANWEKTDRIKSKKIDRLEHLKALEGPSMALAEEYIRKAPLQIATEFRKKIENELNWHPIAL